jgi:bisphosphoglycerate-dependent phosphoglycerate mutase
MRTLIYLIRHGSVVGAETRRFIGHLDVALSALGERQMTALAEPLAAVKLDAVYSSDLSRSIIVSRCAGKRDPDGIYTPYPKDASSATPWVKNYGPKNSLDRASQLEVVCRG